MNAQELLGMSLQLGWRSLQHCWLSIFPSMHLPSDCRGMEALSEAVNSDCDMLKTRWRMFFATAWEVRKKEFQTSRCPSSVKTGAFMLPSEKWKHSACIKWTQEPRRLTFAHIRKSLLLRFKSHVSDTRAKVKNGACVFMDCFGTPHSVMIFSWPVIDKTRAF